MLAIDLLINFNKGYYAFGEGRVIDDKYLIMKRYLKSYFTIDIISNLSDILRRHWTITDPIILHQLFS